MEWIVAAVLVLVGLVGAVGLWLGLRDPVTKRYKPSVSGLFWIGRSMRPPDHLRDDAAKEDSNTKQRN